MLISLWILIQILWFLIPWISFQVFFPNISIFLISHHDSSSDLIEFQKIIWKYHISLWNRPLFTTILLNSWLFDKIGVLGICFDTNWCVINDCINSIRHTWTSLKRTCQVSPHHIIGPYQGYLHKGLELYLIWHFLQQARAIWHSLSSSRWGLFKLIGFIVGSLSCVWSSTR